MKNIFLGLCLTLAATPAFATRARLEALGESKFGSYYINDDRNMFLNPAQLVQYKNKAFFELGSDPGSTAVDKSVTANRPQGGYVGKMGDYTYGLYLNNTSDRAIDFTGQLNTFITIAGGAANTFVGPDSQVEFLFAGEGDLGWGVSLLYAGNGTKTSGVDKTATVMGTRLGIISGDLQVFTNIGLLSSSKFLNGQDNELKGKLSIDAAATYRQDDLTWFGRFTTYGADATNQTTFATTTATTIRNLGFGLGVGKKHEMTKDTTMYCRVEGDYLSQEINNVPAALLAAVNVPKVTYWNVPLVMGAESKALDWLTIRGSVAMSLAGQQSGARGLIASTTGANVRNSFAGTTTVAAGVGMKFGDFAVDGLVATNGTQPAVTAYNTIPGFGTGPLSNQSFGLGDGMLSRIAMTYNF